MTYADAMAEATRVTSKYRHYAPLYDVVLATLPPAPTVVEIGIANGGSLQTWRTLLGPDARIVGIDLNPAATALAAEGFEVRLVDTGSESSWTELRREFGGQVDLLVDDGGHTNRQQILAVVEGIDLVRDGGWIVLEDMHASFMREFGNPSPFSTHHFLSDLLGDLHRSHPRSSVSPRRPHLAASIDYVVSATSWVGLRVRRHDAGDYDEITSGSDATLMDYDHRWDLTFGRPVGGAAATAVLRIVRRVAGPLFSAVDGARLRRRDARR
jgi:hypothetical protein